ncbi:MAG TPA: PIN domain-containing protein, partial [Kineosporiaceae bacterium]|nr:PIN domain-containing protein [Kineosporiaceae bacterium]
MTLVLDAGGISAFAGDLERLVALRQRLDRPPLVPVVVLVEALTGDHRRDHATNRLLRLCEIRSVDQVLARDAARLRTLTGRAGTISATDAIVAAFADRQHDPVIVTS